MKCGRFEDLIISSIDGRLDLRSERLLEEHLGSCPVCRGLAARYRAMAVVLHDSRLEEEPPAWFVERLRPRLREEAKAAPVVFFEKLCLKAIPVFLAVAFFLAGLFILSPGAKELTNSEKLLLGHETQITEARNIWDEQKPGSRSMLLVFTGLEEFQSNGRPAK